MGRRRLARPARSVEVSTRPRRACALQRLVAADREHVRVRGRRSTTSRSRVPPLFSVVSCAGSSVTMCMCARRDARRERLRGGRVQRARPQSSPCACDRLVRTCVSGSGSAHAVAPVPPPPPVPVPVPPVPVPPDPPRPAVPPPCRRAAACRRGPVDVVVVVASCTTPIAAVVPISVNVSTRNCFPRHFVLETHGVASG